MNSETVPEFWTCYYRLSPSIRQLARATYQKWVENPHYPSLQFKQVGPVFSIRVGAHHRALGYERPQGTIRWTWIGTHEEYNHLLSRLRRGRSDRVTTPARPAVISTFTAGHNLLDLYDQGQRREAASEDRCG